MKKFSAPKIENLGNSKISHAKLLLIMCVFTVFSFAGCNSVILDAKNETVDAIKNLQTEATNVKEGFETKIKQLQDAKASVDQAFKSVDQAVNDVKTVIGGEEESTTDTTGDDGN